MDIQLVGLVIYMCGTLVFMWFTLKRFAWLEKDVYNDLLEQFTKENEDYNRLDDRIELLEKNWFTQFESNKDQNARIALIAEDIMKLEKSTNAFAEEYLNQEEDEDWKYAKLEDGLNEKITLLAKDIMELQTQQKDQVEVNQLMAEDLHRINRNVSSYGEACAAREVKKIKRKK